MEVLLPQTVELKKMMEEGDDTICPFSNTHRFINQVVDLLRDCLATNSE